MTLEIIKCVKTMNQRREDYMDLLDKPLTALEAMKQLHYSVEMHLVPAGWQALWKIPRRKCQELKITYPITVLVLVRDVDFKTLTASVEIQDDVQLNDGEEAQLVNLYPTKQQHYSVVIAEATADLLDKLRFFHHHIWLPLDEENGDKQWAKNVLLHRLKVYYDLAAGQITREAAIYIRSLLELARKLGQKIKIKEEENKNEGGMDAVYDLIKYHIGLQYAEMRKPMINKIKQKAKEEAASIRMVFNSGTTDDFIKFLTESKTTIDPQALIRPYPSLHCALNLANPGDTVVLCPGEHHFQKIKALEQGGTIKGFSAASSTVITARNAGQVMLQCAGPALTLENLTINAQAVPVALSVKQGLVQLKGCNIVSTNCTISYGILVSGNGCLEATDCNFTDFGVGITIESGAKAVLNNCSISNCMIGISLLDDASLTMNQCRVSNCLKYGVKLLTKKSSNTN